MGHSCNKSCGKFSRALREAWKGVRSAFLECGSAIVCNIYFFDGDTNVTINIFVVRSHGQDFEERVRWVLAI